MNTSGDYDYEMHLRGLEELWEATVEDHAFLMHADAVDMEGAVDRLMELLDRSPDAVALADAWARLRLHLDRIIDATPTFGARRTSVG